MWGKGKENNTCLAASALLNSCPKPCIQVNIIMYPTLRLLQETAKIARFLHSFEITHELKRNHFAIITLNQTKTRTHKAASRKQLQKRCFRKEGSRKLYTEELDDDGGEDDYLDFWELSFIQHFKKGETCRSFE